MSLEEYAPLQREYDRQARRYDTRWESYLRRSIDETLKRIDARPGERVLDVGCGTGLLLKRLTGAERFGVDATPSMLEIARRRLGPTATLEVAIAEELPFADGAFDVVTSTSVFHFIRRPGLALAEMCRVLRPSGRIVITDWCADFFTTRVLDLFVRVVSAAHVRTYRSRELRGMMEDAGFPDVRIDRFKISPLWGLMCATAVRAGVE